MTNSEIERLRNHILLAGYSDLTETILKELPRTTDVLVVAQDSPQDQHHTDSSCHFLSEDPSDEEVLTQARLSDAQAVLVVADHSSAGSPHSPSTTTIRDRTKHSIAAHRSKK